MEKMWSKKVIVPALVIAVLYIVATIYLMNAGLVKDAVFGSHSLSYKWNLLVALLAGMWTAMSRLSLVLLVVVAILTGANLSLIAQRLQKIRSLGGMRFMVGGSSLLGIVGSGCASCGLSILTFLGVSSAVAYLPFRGIELSFLAAILLSLSLYTLIKGYSEKAVCVDLDKNSSAQKGRGLGSIQH